MTTNSELQALTRTKQGKAFLNRLAKRSHARKVAQERNRERSPADFEAARQQRRLERQTAASAVATAEQRASLAVQECAAARAASAAAEARHAKELQVIQIKMADATNRLAKANAENKELESSHRKALGAVSTMQEAAKALEDRLNAATTEKGKLQAAIHAAEKAAKVVMDQNASLATERDTLKAQVETLRQQYTDAANELAALKAKE